MAIIKSFFRLTRIFWIISRLVLGLIFSYCVIFLLEGADTADYISAGFFALIGLVLLWNFVAGLFLGGATKWLRIISGIVLVILAVALLYSTVDVFGIAEAAVIMILPIWLFLAGVFEIVSRGRKNLSSQKVDLPANLL